MPAHTSTKPKRNASALVSAGRSELNQGLQQYGEYIGEHDRVPQAVCDELVRRRRASSPPANTSIGCHVAPTE